MPPLQDSSTACPAAKGPTRLYTVGEASEAWAIPQSTLYQLIREGRVGSRHIGRSVRVTFDDMEEFVRGCAR